MIEKNRKTFMKKVYQNEEKNSIFNGKMTRGIGAPPAGVRTGTTARVTAERSGGMERKRKCGKPGGRKIAPYY